MYYLCNPFAINEGVCYRDNRQCAKLKKVNRKTI